MVRGIEDQDVVQRIATQLYRIRGVNKVGIDRATRALVVECSNETVISPWALATAVEQARDQTLAIGGPFGWFRIETAAEAGAPTAARSVYSRSIGEVR
jgi:hypothetical protein